MGSNLARVISHIDASKITTAFFKQNKKTGARTATVIANGVLHSKTITKTGIQIITTVIAPVAQNTVEKKAFAKDLAKNGLQQINIAGLLDVSQSTISRWLHK